METGEGTRRGQGSRKGYPYYRRCRLLRNRVGASPCGQYHLDKKNLWKGGTLEMRTIQMPGAFAAKARQGTLDHPCIEAQASGRQPRRAQVCPQALHQGGTLIQSNQDEFMDRLLDDFNGMRETQAIGVQVILHCGPVNQEADAMLQEQQAGEFLLDRLWTATAQGLLRLTQMGFVLINRQFNFPALVIEGDDPFGRRLLALEQSV